MWCFFFFLSRNCLDHIFFNFAHSVLLRIKQNNVWQMILNFQLLIIGKHSHVNMTVFYFFFVGMLFNKYVFSLQLCGLYHLWWFLSSQYKWLTSRFIRILNCLRHYVIYFVPYEPLCIHLVVFTRKWTLWISYFSRKTTA